MFRGLVRDVEGCWTHGPKKRKKGTWREAKFPLSGNVRLRSSHEEIPDISELRRTDFSDGLPAVTPKSRVYVCDEE
jgi:hypothetical protein